MVSCNKTLSSRVRAIEGASQVRSWMKLAVVTALFVMVLGVGVASAQVTVPTTDPYQVTTTLDPNAGGAGASQGLPKTGTSSSIPTAVVAAGMVAAGSVLAIAARRRNAARRTLS